MNLTRCRPAAIALLLALAFGLAGPQPCRAMAPRIAFPAVASTAETHTPCHMPMASSEAPAAPGERAGAFALAAGGDCCDHGATPGERLQCERSCALTAVLASRPAAFAVGPPARVASAPAPMAVPLFAAAIDHIPL